MALPAPRVHLDDLHHAALSMALTPICEYGYSPSTMLSVHIFCADPLARKSWIEEQRDSRWRPCQ
jgi:hypothetical protein